MRTNKYILLAATLLGLSSCGNKKGDYDASGTFEATEVIVSSEANGKIMQFNIEEGQLLKADEEVGCIDTLQLYLKKMQLLASGKAIASKSTDINKQIAATKEQIGKAEYERKRTENLLKENAATQKQIDDIDSQIAVLKKQLEAQISTLQRGNASITEESSAYEIQVAQLDDQLRKCHITSPICGTVLAKYAEAGELATQGKPLFKVADVQHLFLRAYITADQLSQLKLGDKVKVFSDLGKDDRREYEGTITWISDKSEFTPKTIQTRDERANLVYATKIAVKNDEGKIHCKKREVYCICIHTPSFSLDSKQCNFKNILLIILEMPNKYNLLFIKLTIGTSNVLYLFISGIIVTLGLINSKNSPSCLYKKSSTSYLL